MKLYALLVTLVFCSNAFSLTTTLPAKRSSASTIEMSLEKIDLQIEDTTLRTQYFRVPFRKSHSTLAYGEYSQKTSAGDTEGLKETQFKAQYLYGITDLQAIGVAWDIGYRATGGNQNQQETGLGDLHFLGRGVWSIADEASVFYGLDVGVSPDNAEVGIGGRTGNRFSGGWSMEPVAGVQWDIEKEAVAGVQLSYLNRFQRSVKYQDRDIRVTGGDIFRARLFAEAHLRPVTLSAYIGPVSYLKASDGDIEISSSYDSWDIGLQSRISLNKEAQVYLGLEGASISTSNRSQVLASAGMQIDFAQ